MVSPLIFSLSAVESDKVIRFLRWPTRAIQKYNFQYNNIKYSTTICIPGQKIHSSTTIYIPVQQYVFQYNNIYPSTKIIIPEQKDVYSSTDIYFHSGAEL